jgi:hypothetical protein
MSRQEVWRDFSLNPNKMEVFMDQFIANVWVIVIVLWLFLVIKTGRL